jgi:hypothetical protein
LASKSMKMAMRICNIWETGRESLQNRVSTITFKKPAGKCRIRPLPYKRGC